MIWLVRFMEIGKFLKRVNLIRINLLNIQGVLGDAYAIIF